MASVHHPPELQATLNASAKAHNLAPSPVSMKTAKMVGPTPNHPPKVVMPFTGEQVRRWQRLGRVMDHGVGSMENRTEMATA